MHSDYTVKNGIAWHKEADETTRPTAHVGTADGSTTAELLYAIEKNLDGGRESRSGVTYEFNIADHLLHENDTLEYLTLSLPVTTLFEGRLLLREMRAWEHVGFVEFQQTYLHPITLLDGREYGDASVDVSGVLTESTPDDPRASEQYGPQQMRAYEAQERLKDTDTDAEAKVVVIDSGIDPEHENLRDQIPADAGEDFQDGVGGDTDPTYPDVRGGDHGVHTSGTAAATAGNGVGTAGVAGLPDVTLQGAKIFGANPRTLGQTVAEAIQWATDEGADAINMSIGGTGRFGLPSKTVARAIEYADDNDTVCVASSGNAGADKVAFPARHPKVVGVGAVDDDRNVARFSNQGDGVDVAAAGVRVLSTLPENEYGEKSGTSMSAPHVTGGVALGRLAAPDASAAELRQALRDTAQSVEGADADAVGAGIPDLVKYVETLRE